MQLQNPNKYSLFFAQLESTYIGGVAIGIRWSSTEIRFMCASPVAVSGTEYGSVAIITVRYDSSYKITEIITYPDSTAKQSTIYLYAIRAVI